MGRAAPELLTAGREMGIGRRSEGREMASISVPFYNSQFSVVRLLSLLVTFVERSVMKKGWVRTIDSLVREK